MSRRRLVSCPARFPRSGAAARRLTAIVVLTTLVSVTPACAQSRDARIEDRANRALRDMGRFLGDAEEFSFSADVSYDSILVDGRKIQYGGVSEVYVRRDDRLRAEYRGDERHSSVVYDGSRITILDRQRNLYSQEKVPGNIDAAVDAVFDRYGFTVPIADFVYADPYAVLTQYVQTGAWVGRHEIDGHPCHHLSFRQESIDWQIWIEDGPRPVPRKLVITFKDEVQAPQYTAVLRDWDFEPRLSDGWFEFDPPIGADPIEFLPLDTGDATEMEATE